MPLTLTHEPDRERIKIVWSGTPTTTITLWRRISRFGAGWEFVRSAYSISGTTGAFVVWDYEYPITGEEITYAVRAGTALPISSSTSGVITPPRSEYPWLRHLGIPDRSTRVVVQDIADLSRPGRLGLFEPIGRKFPVVVWDVRGSRRGSVRLLARSTDESSDIDTAIDDGAPLLLQLPNSRELEFPDCYMALQDVSWAPLNGRSESGRRIYTLTFVESDRPAGNVQPATSRTYAEVLTETPTYVDVRNETPTYLDVLLGT